MTQTIEFKKDQYGDYIATTGERIAKYRGAELWGAGSSGWYITEADGEFYGIKFGTLTDAKRHLIRQNNSIQFTEMVLAESAAALAKYAQTQKVGA